VGRSIIIMDQYQNSYFYELNKIVLEINILSVQLLGFDLIRMFQFIAQTIHQFFSLLVFKKIFYHKFYSTYLISIISIVSYQMKIRNFFTYCNTPYMLDVRKIRSAKINFDCLNLKIFRIKYIDFHLKLTQ
jgi:hypothetical protein